MGQVGLTRPGRGVLRVLVAVFVAALAFAGSAALSAFADTEGGGPGQPGSVSGAVSTASGEVDANASVGGPIVIMGIDAEDGGPGSHGPTSVYASVLDSLIAEATNGGNGILVLGGGKSATDDVTTWWDEVTGLAGITPTYTNGASNITSQSFAGFKIIGVVSGDGETPDGGLTAAESEALAAREADIATFVNSGGGLLVFAQDFDDATTSNYAFLGGVGSFTFTTELSYDAIAPTADGSAIGITDDLDVCCWHDTYQTYPSFLKVLANGDDSGDPDSFGQVAALGGANVIIGPQPEPEPTPTPEPQPIEAAPAQVVLQPRFTG